MEAQVVEEKAKVNLERKPRFFRRGFNAVFELSGESAVVFKGLVKHLAGEFFGKSYYGADALTVGFELDGLAVRVMDSGRVKLADVKLNKCDFDEFSVNPYKRWRLPELPAYVGLPMNELLYALESVGKDARVRFSVVGVYKCRSYVETKTFRVPEVCPKCGRQTHPALNALPADKRGKDGRSFKCSNCGWRGKVREKTRKVRVWRCDMDRDSCEVVVEVVEGDRCERFALTVFEPEVLEASLPKIPVSVTVKLALKDFYAVLDRLGKKCETVKVEASSDGLTLHGKGDFVKAEFPIKRGSDMLLDIKAKGKTTATYKVDELKACLPRLGDIATISFSENMPIKTEINTPLANSTVSFWLAPVIQS
ncbi:MAG: hypothetical protein QXO00_04165 [Candidatus Bathyarchaeia archaeon]